MDKTMVLKARISEKAYGLSQTRNTYVFSVPVDANKLSVSLAVSTQYGVSVKTVKIANVKGKPKRVVRKGGRPTTGTRSDSKKAYVTLISGDSLPIFASVEAADKKEAKAAAKTAKEKK